LPLPNHEAELLALRSKLDGDALLNRLDALAGKLLVSAPIGGGKSYAVDSVIRAAVGRYSLTVALSPTREVQGEREMVRQPPGGHKVVVLRPRPSADCGKERDRRWRIYEKNALSLLGRAELCGGCNRVKTCFWPGQYSMKNMKGARVVFGTQSHLERSPFFLSQMQQATCAEGRVLVILDESRCVMARARRSIQRRHIEMYIDALSTLGRVRGWRHHNLIYQSTLLLAANTSDLRSTDWEVGRPSSSKWELAAQCAGVDKFGDEFRDIAHDFHLFAQSPLTSRERGDDGSVIFAVTPFLGFDTLILSGTSNPEFIAHRLGMELPHPFSSARIIHPGTDWTNIASRIGMRKFFPSNFPQICDFFASLIAKRLSEGKRPLIIVKKRFRDLTLREMQKRLREIGCDDARVVDGYDKDVDLGAPGVVPVVTFGSIGTNRFADFTAAYCLSGFYASPRDVEDLLQEVRASDYRIAVDLRSEGFPPRRIAGAANAADRIYDVHRIADLARRELEDDVVLQAIGRVRLFTKPREIVTIQCAEFQDVTREFTSLAETRRFFGLSSRRESKRDATALAVAAAREDGITKKEAARRIGVSPRTVRRHWNG
jgi:hypothetical protein